MHILHYMRRTVLSTSCLILLLICIQASSATAVIAAPSQRQMQVGHAQSNPETTHLLQLKQSGRLAKTVNVLSALPPTTILQFPLVPSGIKQKFPDATGLVTIVRGDRDNSTSDTVTIDVQKMPPNITFTIFFIEIASKPFGHVEYVADLTTRGDGSGESIFHIISLVSFAMDARNPGSSQDDKEGLTSGTNLEHLGMWFSSLQDAQKTLNDETLKGTIFDGGNPPLHAGPQAMTDGQSAPVF
ncbi:MAG: hypothetical protein M3Y39_07995 [Chloroflexota bacterium]|nr:hypothetical protein [Chloroflexota bacterium]